MDNTNEEALKIYKQFEFKLKKINNFEPIEAGIDETGRGAFFGPQIYTMTLTNKHNLEVLKNNFKIKRYQWMTK